MAHDADLALDALRPPARPACPYQRLACAVILHPEALAERVHRAGHEWR